MKEQENIEQILREAPAAEIPDALKQRLRVDLDQTAMKGRPSIIRDWFAPDGVRLSYRRLAVAAAIAIVVVLPLSYGAAKIVKRFTIEEFETTDRTIKVISGDNISEENVGKIYEEMKQLIEDGKAEETSPGEYKGALSNGDEVVFRTGRLPIEIKSKSEKFKEKADEIKELYKAGKFERTLIGEVEKDGTKFYFYNDHFILSDGTTFTVTTLGEEKNTEEGKGRP